MTYTVDGTSVVEARSDRWFYF